MLCILFWWNGDHMTLAYSIARNRDHSIMLFKFPNILSSNSF